MERETALPHLQKLAICTYPEPDKYNARPLSCFWKSILVFFFSCLNLGLTSWPFPQVSPSKNNVRTFSCLHKPRMFLPRKFSWFRHRVALGNEYTSKYVICNNHHGRVVSIFISNREVLCMDLDPETGYGDMTFVLFLISSRQIPGFYLKLGNDRYLPLRSQLIIVRSLEV